MSVYRTYSQKPGEIPRKWHVADASGIPLGRLASRVAAVLRGKHKATFTPHMDCGDGVIVVNASKVVLTGKKLDKKTHWHHTGFPGGLRITPMKIAMRDKPERVVEWAVRGMLPHTRLGDRQIRHLKVYRGPDHKNAAQQPTPLQVPV